MENLKIISILIVLSIILIGALIFRDINKQINTDVSNSIIKGVIYLTNNQNDDGSISLNNTETFKVWETANTILVVHTVDKHREQFLRNATNFLTSTQRDDGSFHYMRFSQEHCMETTTVGVLVLALNREDISEEISFMLKSQYPDGSWEIGFQHIEKDRFFPSVTGFVLNSLMCLNISNENISKGIEYIKKSQHEDGSWGTSWAYYDTPYYATYPNLLALKLYGLEESDTYTRAVSYIKQNQNSDGSWGDESPDRPSKELRTALALNSLLIYPVETDTIERGVNWLIKNQSPDGYWEGGYFVNISNKKEDIFATNMAILALKRYESYKNNETLLCPITRIN